VKGKKRVGPKEKRNA